MTNGPIAVVGATGYTGGRVLASLARRGVSVRLVGRNLERLTRAASGLDNSEVRAVTSWESEPLGQALEGSSAIISCAGPFVRAGRPVVAGNTIAFNGDDGVEVQVATGNPIRGNSIHDNSGAGIDLVSGGNTELGAPTVTSAGSASGMACANCEVDVFSDDVDEGHIFHGSVTANGASNWSFPGAVIGPNVTATATDASGNTSEFSAPFSGCTDTDGDSVCDSGDPDDDNDSLGLGDPLWFRDEIELFVGTDPLSPCADDGTPDNEADDKWPPDLTDDQAINVFDRARIVVNLLASNQGVDNDGDGMIDEDAVTGDGIDNDGDGFTDEDPGYDVRLDLNADGLLNVQDRAIEVLYVLKFQETGACPSL